MFNIDLRTAIAKRRSRQADNHQRRQAAARLLFYSEGINAHFLRIGDFLSPFAIALRGAPLRFQAFLPQAVTGLLRLR